MGRPIPLFAPVTRATGLSRTVISTGRCQHLWMPARADHRAQTQSSHATNDCSLRSLDVSYAELTASFAALRTRGRTTLRRGAFVRQQLAVTPTPGRAA